jgi:hypothetical protein
VKGGFFGREKKPSLPAGGHPHTTSFTHVFYKPSYAGAPRDPCFPMDRSTFMRESQSVPTFGVEVVLPGSSVR